MAKFVIGSNGEARNEEARVREFGSGMKIVETGDAKNIVKGQKPIKEGVVKVNKEEKKELLKEPDKFKIERDRLVRKGKNK